MRYPASLLTVCSIFLLIQACSQAPGKKESGNDPLIQHMDSSVHPAQNFFRFANNRWFKENPIPASENSNGIFRTIADMVNDDIMKICESSAADTKAETGSNKKKIGDFYSSGMDTLAIEKAGLTPLNEELQKIEAVSDLPSLMKALAHLHRIGAGGMFSFYVNNDDKISSKNALFIWQGGLGLPDRDYYFNTDERNTNLRKEYVKHISRMFQLMGHDDATSGQFSQTLMAMETDMAKASRKLEDTRDPVKNYNKVSITEMYKICPNVNWNELMTEMGVHGADTVILGQPEFMKALNVQLKKYTLSDWKLYLRWNLVNSYASYLSKPFDNQNFAFYGTVLSGQKEQKPRWKRVVEQTDGSLGELIGQVYVSEYCPKGTKEKLMEIGENIRTVYADRIKNLDWMSDSTKQKALNKLNKVMMKVGYPDKWKDMSSLTIDRGPYVLNVMRANTWGFQYMTNKFGKPVDRTEWGMYPQTYNAYYNPSNNEIVVPACNIIVPGFELADDAVLYGIIGGSTFGHELTHGFDDQGSQYDENGNLADWWSKEDREKFVAKTQRIVKQYNDYAVLDSMHVNGDATQGENIADLGGIVMGYEAFKKTEQYKKGEKINGLTPDQRFFLGYGYAWMVNLRPESMARQIMSDVHSPSEFRVNGPLSDMPEFYAAFGVKEGDAMWRPDSLRVRIW